MPKLLNRPPKMSKKSDGQAYVTLQGKRIYLGRYGSPEALSAYNAVVAEYSTAKTVSAFRTNKTALVDELFLSYLEYAESEGVDQRVKSSVRTILKFVSPLYGSVEVDKFRAVALKAIQGQIAQSTYSRGKTVRAYSRQQVNKFSGLIVRIFKWGVSNEVVQEETWRVLDSVGGLKEGKARESERRENVPTSEVIRTLPFMPSIIADMVMFQLLTACRPGEIIVARKRDFVESDGVIVYTPETHKNKWRGQKRNIVVPREAVEIVKRRSKGKADDDYIFSPKDARLEKWVQDRANRKTPMTPSQRQRAQDRAPTKFDRYGERYGQYSLNQAVGRAIARANAAGVDVPHWTPYQIRHEALTQIRLKYGSEVAQAVAGHRHADTTETYYHNQVQIAARILKDK